MAKTIYKFVALIAVISAVAILSVGCGSKNTTNTNTKKTTTNTTQKSNTTQNTTAGTGNTSALGSQKIVYIRENDDTWMMDQQNASMKAFVDSGYTQIEIVKLNGSRENAYKVLENIKNSKPGVVVISPEAFAHVIIAKGLEGTGIPVILTSHAEQLNFIDPRDTPVGNVTGVKTFTQGIELSAIKLLDFVSPANGKKAVFLNDPTAELFPRKKVEAALKELNIELKDYVTTTTKEQLMSATAKYNNDKEVGWILVGAPPRVDSAGNSVESSNILNWFARNSSKPSVSFTETSSSSGVLCALGTDPKKVGEQAAAMVSKVLRGDGIKNVAAERPKSINIAINVKTASFLGINFTNDILGSATKVFTDYEGNYLKQ